MIKKIEKSVSPNNLIRIYMLEIIVAVRCGGFILENAINVA